MNTQDMEEVVEFKLIKQLTIKLYHEPAEQLVKFSLFYKEDKFNGPAWSWLGDFKSKEEATNFSKQFKIIYEVETFSL